MYNDSQRYIFPHIQLFPTLQLRSSVLCIEEDSSCDGATLFLEKRYISSIDKSHVTYTARRRNQYISRHGAVVLGASDLYWSEHRPVLVGGMLLRVG